MGSYFSPDPENTNTDSRRRLVLAPHHPDNLCPGTVACSQGPCTSKIHLVLSTHACIFREECSKLLNLTGFLGTKFLLL
jgi:hypothetical protein